MLASRLGFALFGLSLAACQQDASSIRPAGLVATGGATTAAIQPALCPPSGSELRTSDGRQFAFLGRDGADPEICLWNVSGVSTVSRQLHGLTPPDGETGQQARVGLRGLFPLSVGRSASYTLQRTDGIWRLTWRVIGEQRITVPAGTFDVWVLEGIEEGQLGNSFRGERIFYIEKATGMAVKVDSRVVRGRANWANWEAISVRRPS